MTTPPPEPAPLPDGASGPIPPPPPLPPAPPGGERGPRRYDMRTVASTAAILVVVIAVATWIVPPVGLLVPLVLLGSVFFLINSNPSVRYRSVLSGVMLGLGVGLFVTAGVCTAIAGGVLNSPTFP